MPVLTRKRKRSIDKILGDEHEEVHYAMENVGLGLEYTFPTKRCKRQGSKKVISYCLYSPYTEWSDVLVSEFHRYIHGLEQNLKLRDRYFPSWIIYLYLDQTLVYDCEINEILKKANDVRVIPFFVNHRDPSANGMINHHAVQRYKVLWDKSVDVCIIRDIDQLLTAEDAKLVNSWIDGTNYLYLVYKWSRMTLFAMGGGFGQRRVRGHHLIIDLFPYDELVSDCLDRYSNSDIAFSRGRGFDEYCMTVLERMGAFPLFTVCRIVTEHGAHWYNGRKVLIRSNNHMLNKPYATSCSIQQLRNRLVEKFPECVKFSRSLILQYEYDFIIAILRNDKLFFNYRESLLNSENNRKWLNLE